MDFLKQNASIEDCRNCAKEIIPDGTNSTTNAWNSYAREMLEALLKHAVKEGKTSNEFIFHLFNSPIHSLKELVIFQAPNMERVFMDENAKMLSCVLSIVGSKLYDHDSKKQF